MDNEKNLAYDETVDSQNELPEEQIQSNGYDQPEDEVAPSVLVNDYKKIKLLDLFIKLKQYLIILQKSFNNVEHDAIDVMQTKRLNNTYDELSRLLQDAEFYIDNVYEYDDYNKNLYTYLLYNKKSSELISSFRNTLHLDKVQEENK